MDIIVKANLSPELGADPIERFDLGSIDHSRRMRDGEIAVIPNATERTLAFALGHQEAGKLEILGIENLAWQSGIALPASAVISVEDDVTAGDTVEIGGTTFEIRAPSAVDGDFTPGNVQVRATLNDDEEVAENLAAAINGVENFPFVATASGSNVLVEYAEVGLVGNGEDISADAGARIVILGGLEELTGGTYGGLSRVWRKVLSPAAAGADIITTFPEGDYAFDVKVANLSDTLDSVSFADGVLTIAAPGGAWSSTEVKVLVTATQI